jgi:hypothetical protein
MRHEGIWRASFIHSARRCYLCVLGNICYPCLRTGQSDCGGGRGIRTPERVTPLTVFKTAGFNHSPIPPIPILPDFIHLTALSLPRSTRLRHNCHWFGTTSNRLNRTHFGLFARVRVAHRDDDCRMPEQFLHGYNVGAFPEQPRCEGAWTKLRTKAVLYYPY